MIDDPIVTVHVPPGLRSRTGCCDVRTRQGLETPLAGEDVLSIVPVDPHPGSA